MRFPRPLVPATLIRRYKRFLADVTLDTGETVTVHCANSGTMMGLNAPGNRVWLLPKTGTTLPYSWELVEVALPGGSQCVGINTMHPNRLAEEAIVAGRIAALAGYPDLRREVRYGENSRVDLVLAGGGRPPCFVEVKNVHLMRRAGLAEFPDCVTARGAKHLGELARVVAEGGRAVMLFVVQMRAECFALADDLDPGYAAAFTAARAAGVEAIACTCTVTPEGIAVEREIAITGPAPAPERMRTAAAKPA
jgi:sugar fermentation stimulation protein A